MELRDSVDLFSIMTYDFTAAFSPGPTAPLFWIAETVMKLIPPNMRQGHDSKLMIGLNLYGYDFKKLGGKEALIGSKVK